MAGQLQNLAYLLGAIVVVIWLGIVWMRVVLRMRSSQRWTGWRGANVRNMVFSNFLFAQFTAIPSLNIPFSHLSYLIFTLLSLPLIKKRRNARDHIANDYWYKSNVVSKESSKALSSYAPPSNGDQVPPPTDTISPPPSKSDSARSVSKDATSASPSSTSRGTITSSRYRETKSEELVRLPVAPHEPNSWFKIWRSS